MTPTLILDNLHRIQERIAAAAHAAGRRPDDIILIAVSKIHPAAAIRAAYDAGLRHFGENRVQEWEGKHAALTDVAATWHLIGHLQSNKAARAAKLFHSVDSLDDFALAERLARARTSLADESITSAKHAAPAGVTLNNKLRVLIEVRIADEAAKTGAPIADLPALAEKIAALPPLNLQGLMCIPPFLDDPEKVRPYFRRLRALRDDLSRRLARPLPVLSMGMSHDFESAIAEGATEIRIGTALFGPRPTSRPVPGTL